MKWLSDIMLQALTFFYQISGPFGNYGWSIIFLTVAINIALYPLTLTSVKQMAALQKIQPKMAELQKKLKDKPAEMQKALGDLYKEEKVNPFGGCLPMLLKIPFFIALFFALQSKEFLALIAKPGIRASFLWIKDLALPDPLYLMPIFIVISTYFAQSTMPGAKNQQNKSMMYMMPFFIGFISLKFGAGLQIYWTFSNLVAVCQQWYIGRSTAQDIVSGGASKKNVSRETF